MLLHLVRIEDWSLGFRLLGVRNVAPPGKDGVFQAVGPWF